MAELVEDLDDPVSPISEYDYVIVDRDQEELQEQILAEGGRACSDLDWLKQCIISGSIQP